MVIMADIKLLNFPQNRFTNVIIKFLQLLFTAKELNDEY